MIINDLYNNKKTAVAEGVDLDQQALAVANKLTSGKNLQKLQAMRYDSTVYRALDRYFAKNNLPENIYNRVAYIVFERINQQGVAEGFSSLDPKVKGKIQNIVSRLSDEYGMWDHKKQTFTPQGLEHLKSILKFNIKYIKYALSLTSRDFEAEGVAEESDRQFAQRMKKQAEQPPTKGMSNAEKVDKGWRNPNIPSEQIYKVVALTKSNALAKPTKMKVKADSIEDLFARLSANDWYPLEINGVEVIAGKRLKQGVAEADAPVTHRIGLTVIDPNHPMVSKRREQYQKSVRVTAADREAAINQAIAHLRRKGYKVLDHHYLGTVNDLAEVSLDDYRKKARLSRAMAQTSQFFGRDDPATVAAANQTIAKRERGLARADTRVKPYTAPAHDAERYQRDLTARYPNIDELVRQAELRRDPNYDYAEGDAYYRGREAEQNYQQLKQIQRVIQGLNESLQRTQP